MPRARPELLSAEVIGRSADFPGGEEAVLIYDLGGWTVTIRSFVYSPSGDFDSLHLAPPGYPEQFTTPAGGITYDLMRAIPLQKARVEIDRLKAEAWRLNGDNDGELAQIPERMSGDEDWLRFAALFASFVAQGERQPSQRLARISGLSKETINTRVRRTREKGLLTRPTKDNPGELTKDAKKALKALDATTERGA